MIKKSSGILLSQTCQGRCLLYRSIFVWFMTMREKQILVRATGIQKENWGLAGHFLEIIKQQLFQKAVKYKAMYDIFPNLSFVISEKCLVTNFLDT